MSKAINWNDDTDIKIEDLFVEEKLDKEHSEKDRHAFWNLLIVDDDKDIHRTTKFVLSDFEYKNKKLNLISAYSAQEAKQILKQNSDIALILLDVVMEEDNAGLTLVNFIRNNLKNSMVRIILRTGQPGQAPLKEVIINYDINDYKSKAELTIEKLHAALITALRDYTNIQIINNHNKELEEKVKQRTQELADQKHVVEQKNKQLLDSITCAKRIQNAILPPVSELKKILPNIFVYNQPKDVVSGDFLWVKKIENKIVLTVGDCIGHGVPGAFMTIIGCNLLEDVLYKNTNLYLNSTAKYLDELKNTIIQKLNYNDTPEDTTDSIDLSLIIIDKENNTIQFSGAFNSLIQIRNNKLTEIKGDRFPIGKHYVNINKKFTEKNIIPQKNDIYYMYSDGYQDQIGYKNYEKFLKIRFKELLLEIHQKPLAEQKQILADTINKWMGKPSNQTDDMLVLGFKF